MTSYIDVINAALLKLGVAPIVSINDAVDGARNAKLRYDSIRQKCISSHTWNFARTRVSLAPLATTPAFGYSYQFQLPPDCLRIESPGVSDFSREGQRILCNDSVIDLTYFRDEEDPTAWPSYFIEYVVSSLASELCHSLTQSLELKAQLVSETEEVYKRSKQINAKEDAQKFLSAELFLDGRRNSNIDVPYSGGSGYPVLTSSSSPPSGTVSVSWESITNKPTAFSPSSHFHTGSDITSGVITPSMLATGVQTFLANPSSANLAAALTDESGSGTVAFTTSPTFVTPTLGVASATSLTFGSSVLLSDATNINAQRNGTSAQGFRIYNTYTDASNYERLGLFWSAGNCFIGTEQAGTGTAKALFIRTASTNIWQFTSSGHIFAQTDNAYDFGASGANRARDIRAARNLVIAMTDSLGGGVGVINIGNAGTSPTTNPTGGGILYCEAGALKFRGTSGTVTTIAVA